MKVGDMVELKSGSFPGAGGVNQVMLLQEKYFGGQVPVVSIDGKYATVKLPSLDTC